MGCCYDAERLQKRCTLYHLCFQQMGYQPNPFNEENANFKKGQLKGAIGDLGHRNLQSMYCTERIWINKVIDDV